MVITQFDKDDVEDLGLIKLDLLSLRTMSAVGDAVASIRRNGGSLITTGYRWMIPKPTG